MMVYVVLRGHQYDSDEVIGVFRDEHDAVLEVASHKHPSGSQDMDFYYQKHELQ